MKRIWLFFYNLIFIPVSYLIIIIAYFVNAKNRRGISGRKNLFQNLEKTIAQFSADHKRILVHASSYGEFLQVKPVLIQIKKINPDIIIIVSVFSPSGYENIKLEQPVDYLCYFPFDTYFQIKKFISIISPQAAMIVRHDIWPNFVLQMNIAQIPLVLVDASLPDNSSRFWPILKGLNKTFFSSLTSILTISNEESKKFTELTDGSVEIKAIGDTKYDQVYEKSQKTDKISDLLKNEHLKKSRIIVGGSTWPHDEAVLISAFEELNKKFDDLLLILAPHEPSDSHIDHIEKQLQNKKLKSVRLSELDNNSNDFKCLIIDRIGILANIYYLGDIAFIGGSFYSKIHNVLEPAVYGVPVVFGPKMETSSEAFKLLKNDAAIIVKSQAELKDQLQKLLVDNEYAKKYGQNAKNVVWENVGSSEKIAEYMLGYL